MKKSSTLFFQTIIVLIGLLVLALMLWEPHLEGRNKNSTLFQIYFNDPFLAYAYIGSVPFFAILYQAFNISSKVTIKALRTIRYCSIILVAFILGAEAYILTVQRGKEDDIAGGVAVGLFLIIISIIIGITVTVFERRVRNTIDTTI